VTAPLTMHVRKILRVRELEQQAVENHIAHVEAQGRVLVVGGPKAEEGWSVRGWRTKELLSYSETGDMEAYAAMLVQRDPGETWYHLDHVWEVIEDIPGPKPTQDIPASLSDALEGWVDGGTPPADIAQVTGWSVARVTECLKQFNLD
jgi:hypothetical protein